MTTTQLPGRIAGRVVKSTNGCWHWTGYIDPDLGYGYLTVGSRADGSRRNVPVHRYVYETIHGALPKRGEPDHMQVDHECHNRSKSCKGGAGCLHRRCVNPAHLVAKTPKDNSGASPHTVASKNRAMTDCPQGHPLSGDNLGFGTDGRRYCKQCQVERTSENRRERLARERGPYWEKVEWNSKKTHCPQGHPYSGSNLIVKPNGARGCRTCSEEAARKHGEKKRTGVVPAGHRSDWTKCPKGHGLSGANLHVDPKSGKRRCRQCHRDRDAARQAAKRAAKKAAG